jgi:hypothetical protein
MFFRVTDLSPSHTSQALSNDKKLLQRISTIRCGQSFEDVDLPLANDTLLDQSDRYCPRAATDKIDRAIPKLNRARQANEPRCRTERIIGQGSLPCGNRLGSGRGLSDHLNTGQERHVGFHTVRNEGQCPEDEEEASVNVRMAADCGVHSPDRSDRLCDLPPVWRLGDMTSEERVQETVLESVNASDVVIRSCRMPCCRFLLTGLIVSFRLVCWLRCTYGQRKS